MTNADEIRAEIEREKFKIMQNDKHIQQREYRVALCRQYGDRLYRRLLTLEAQLEREEARLVRPQPARVDADNWSI